MPKGKVEVEITADDKASATLKAIGNRTDQMSQKMRKAGMIMAGAGIAIAAAIAGTLAVYVKMGDEIDKMAKRTGFAATALSELRHAAQITGADISDLEKAVKKMAKSIIDADRGLETYTRSFREIGLDLAILRAMSPEEQFFAIAGAIGELEDATLQAAIAQEIFGRSGTTLLPLILEGKEGIAALREEAHELGIVFDEEAAAKAAALQDAMTNLKESVQGLALEFADELVPIITEFMEDKVIPLIKSIKDWISENEGLAKALAVIAGLLVAGGALLIGLSLVGKAIAAINTALVIFHALMGAKGWVKLAAGIGIAAASLVTIGALMEVKPEAPKIKIPNIVPEPGARLEFGSGGRVPGAIGEPVPIIAHGGEDILRAGESFGGNVYIGSFMGDETSLRAFMRTMKNLMGKDLRRTSFPGINRLEYFPGSSAP